MPKSTGSLVTKQYILSSYKIGQEFTVAGLIEELKTFLPNPPSEGSVSGFISTSKDKGYFEYVAVKNRAATVRYVKPIDDVPIHHSTTTSRDIKNKLESSYFEGTEMTTTNTSTTRNQAKLVRDLINSKPLYSRFSLSDLITEATTTLKVSEDMVRYVIGYAWGKKQLRRHTVANPNAGPGKAVRSTMYEYSIQRRLKTASTAAKKKAVRSKSKALVTVDYDQLTPRLAGDIKSMVADIELRLQAIKNSVVQPDLTEVDTDVLMNEVNRRLKK